MINFEQIGSIIDEQVKDLVVANPALADDIRSLADSFHVRFNGLKIGSVPELFELCTSVDRKLRLERYPSPLREIIQQSRRDIQSMLIDSFFEEQKKTAYGQFKVMRELDEQRDLVKTVADLIPVIRSKIPKGAGLDWTFNQQWLQLESNGSGLFERVKIAITDRETGTQQWEIFKDMLPGDLRNRFDINNQAVRGKEIAKIIQEWKAVIMKLGPEAVAQFLISTGKVKIPFTKLVKIISEYLGRFKAPDLSIGDLKDIPNQLFELTAVKKLMFILLRKHIYRELVKDGYDGRPDESYKSRFEAMKKKVERELKDKLDLSQNDQKELFESLFSYFQEVLAIKSPERMVTAIQRGDGGFSPFPSFRQKIAMKKALDGNMKIVGDDEGKGIEVKREGSRHLIGFWMGLGKTATSFLSKEHVNAQKMLYICPPNITAEIPKEIGKIYKKGSEPKIGMIVAGMTAQEREAALEAEVVVVPYSMLRTDIVEILKKTNFDFMAVDEVQWARNDEGTYTEAVYQLATCIPNLYDHGTIMLMSGDPTPNGPDDIVPQLRIADKKLYGDLKTLKSTVKNQDPLIVRNVLMDFYLLLDEPENWEEEFVEYFDYTLSEEERKIYSAIFDNDDLDANQKLQQLSLCVINPSLFAGGREVKSALFDQTVQKLEEYFEEYDAVVVTENMYKHAVTREHQKYLGATFVEKLKKYFGDRADIFVYDGDTEDNERKEIIEKSKRKGRKTIIFAMSGTYKEGTNEFSHIHRGIILEPTFNKADTAQLVKRFARGGNNDVEVAVLKASDTVHQGIFEHAQNKYELTQILKYGGTITEYDYAILDNDAISDEVIEVGGRFFFMTAIMDSVTSAERKLAMWFARMQNKGSQYVAEVFQQWGKIMAEIYSENWEASMSGNNARFVTGLIKELETKGLIKGNVFADIASGPLVLDRSFDLYDDGSKQREVHSVDLNPHMLETGTKLKEPKIKPRIGSMTDLKRTFKNDQFDAINCSLAFEFTKHNDRIKIPSESERVQTLLEFNRILKEGGIMILTLTTKVCTEEQFTKFQEQLKHFGFEVVKPYTGCGQSTDDNEESHFENYTLVCRKTGQTDLKSLNMHDLVFSRNEKGVHGRKKIKVGPKPNASKGYVHMSFALNSTEIEVDKNADPYKNQEAYYEEVEKARAILQKMKEENGGTYDNLPNDVSQKLQDQGILIINVFEQLKDEQTPQTKENGETQPPEENTKKKKKKQPQFRRQYMFRLASDKSSVPKQFYLD